MSPTAEAPAAEGAPTSDPTLAHAGLTELEDSSVGAAAASQAEKSAGSQADLVAPLAQTTVSTGANATAEGSYEPTSLTSSATMEDWDLVRDLSDGASGTVIPSEENGEATDAKGQSGNRGRGRNPRYRGRGRGERGDGRGGRGGNRGRGGRTRGRGGANAESDQAPNQKPSGASE